LSESSIENKESPTPTVDELLELTINPADRLWRYPICNAVVKYVAKTPLRPNHVTVFHTALSVAAGFVIAIGTPQAFVAAGVMFETRAILDCLDGALARATKQSSPFGRALDQMGDTIGFLSLMGGALVCLTRLYGILAALVIVALTMLISALCTTAWDLYKRRFTSLMKEGYDSTEEDYLTLCRRFEERPMLSLWVSKVVSLYAWYTLSPQTLPRLRERIANRDWPREGQSFAVTPTGLYLQEAAARNDPELRAMLRRLGIVAGDNIILMLTVSLLLGQYLLVFPIVMAWGLLIWICTVVPVSRYLYAATREPSIKPVQG
jgi:hypothetical protein